MTHINIWPTLYETGFLTSHYKLNCFVCNRTIKRGEHIAQCEEVGGITLRPRMYDGSFYTPDTGSRWVHKNCYPINTWTTYSVLSQVKKDTIEFEIKYNYITSHLNIDPSLSNWNMIKRAYTILGIKSNYDNSMDEHIDDIVYHIKNPKD